MDELAVLVESDETDSPSTKVILYHQHLPHLDTLGYIDWDRETETIAKGWNFEEVLPLIEVLEDKQGTLPGSWP